MNSLDRGRVGNVKGGLSVIQDFYLEFFGTLVPGVIAVTSAILLGFGFYYFITGDAAFVKAASEYVFKSWGFGLLYLIICYVMGAIAYRRNPKTPDTISSHRQWRATREGASSEEVGRLSVTFDPGRAIPKGVFEKLRFWLNREQWILRHAGHNVDYPYPHMRQYLCCRGFSHLAEYVPWCTGSRGTMFHESFEKGKCTKHYVNIIKQRLRNSGRVNLILDMMRNECNIRMLSSLWYIMVFVRRMLLIAFAAAIVVVPVKSLLYPLLVEDPDFRRVEVVTSVRNNTECMKTEYSEQREIFEKQEQKAEEGISWRRLVPTKRQEVVRTLWFFFMTILAAALIAYCQRSIEFGFHYVRTREVTMILESAWILDNVEVMGDSIKDEKSNRKKLFADIKDAADEFKRAHCSICKHCKICYGTEVLS